MQHHDNNVVNSKMKNIDKFFLKKEQMLLFQLVDSS